MLKPAQTFEKIHMELAPDAFRTPKDISSPDVQPSLALITNPTYEFYRNWHDQVGQPFNWHQRPRINDRQRIESLLRQPGVELILLKDKEAPVGYSLTELDAKGVVEVSDFGFLPHLTAKGLGTVFFPMIIDRLIEAGAKRIWLTTRSTNNPKVPAFYKRFGFVEYNRETVAE